MRASRFFLAFAMSATAGWCASPIVGATMPGLQADGANLLHNQWPIRPVGRQVELGDFPVAMAIDPEGRLAAVLHAGYGTHGVRVINIASGAMVASAPLNEAFCGVAFSGDGRTIVCSGGSEGVLHPFSLGKGGGLKALPDVRVAGRDDPGVVAGFALSANAKAAVVALSYDNRVVRVDMASGSLAWTASLGVSVREGERVSKDPGAPNDVLGGNELAPDVDPLNVAWDERRGRAYVSLWGESSVAVLDTADGRVLGRWRTGLHPNELVLAPDGRLFVSNGGLNTVTVLDSSDGRVSEVLTSFSSPGDLPGATPDSLALSHDGSRLFVANAYTNTVAVFDVSEKGKGRALGFIPTGWFPTSVRLTPDDRTLLVVSARGLTAKPSGGSGRPWTKIAGLYPGSLGIVDLGKGDAFGRSLSEWTALAQRCRPAAPAQAQPGDPIPARVGDPSPIRYVVYIIKENRTYDQVLGDMREGNGDPSLCLFPERVTPNVHAIARKFVLFDNFYANAEVSASGHEWSMAGYSSEFVEKSWPVNYSHGDSGTHVPYPAEGLFVAAVPALGYLWDRAAEAGVTYRSYGEFTVITDRLEFPVRTNMAALKGHLDPAYVGWNIAYHDRDRAAEFIAQLRGYEASGDMPRLQIMRLPQDHTAGRRAGSWTPEAMVADNDEALGRVVEALSRSRFWGQTAVFVVEDDAQSGPDHVDAHRTEALVAGGYVRRGAVDSTAYTTCSMIRTIELILGLKPMSQFDAAASPMRSCFQPALDLGGYHAVAAGIDTDARNPSKGRAAEISAHFDLSAEDRIDEQLFNRVIWSAVRGEDSVMPAPVHAAFVRELPGADDDGD